MPMTKATRDKELVYAQPFKNEVSITYTMYGTKLLDESSWVQEFNIIFYFLRQDGVKIDRKIDRVYELLQESVLYIKNRPNMREKIHKHFQVL